MFSAPTVHPGAPRAHETALQAQTADAGNQNYADVQHTEGKQRLVRDRSLIPFDTPSAAVVPERLVKLSPRFGLAPIKELEQGGMPDARVANVTRLPKGGAQSASLVFGFTGDTTKTHGEERQARLGCALLEQGVGHVVIARRGDDKKLMPMQGDFKVAAQGGPLHVKFEEGQSDTADMQTLRIQAQLPSGQTETSSDIGLWHVNWVDAGSGIAVDSIADLLKRVYGAADGGLVAFGCRSGSTRSGALAQLYHQRDVAEQRWNEGHLPTASELMKAAVDWGRRCGTIRNEHFAENMPNMLLEQHAALLETEMKRRLDGPLNGDQPTTAVKPKVAPKPHLASTLEALVRTSPPPARPVPSPRLGGQPSSPRLEHKDMSDTASLNSNASSLLSTSTTTWDSSAEGHYGALHQIRRDLRASNPYGEKSGQALPATLTTPSEAPLPAIYAVATTSSEGAAVQREKPAGRHALEQGFRSSLRRAEATVARLGNSDYDEVLPVMSEAASKEFGSWLTGAHKESGNLAKFLHAVARTFTEEAPRGLRLFAAKDSFGSGKVIKDIRQESGSKLWADVVRAVDETLDNVGAEKASMATRMMEAVLRDQLTQHFKTLDPARQKTWLRRTGEKAVLSGAINELKAELDGLRLKSEPPAQDVEELRPKVQALNLALLSFNAVHQVGNDPSLRHR